MSDDCGVGYVVGAGGGVLGVLGSEDSGVITGGGLVGLVVDDGYSVVQEYSSGCGGVWHD